MRSTSVGVTGLRFTNAVPRKFRETDLFGDSRHFTERTNRSMIRFAQIDTECTENGHGPFSEAATPIGVDGFVGISDN